MMRAEPVWRVLEGNLVAYRRLWRGSIFSSFLLPALFLAALGLGVGGLVERRTGTVAGLGYLQFVTPGILAAILVQQAAVESLWPVMAGTKWQRTFHAAISTPVTPDEVFGGYLAYVALRLVLAAMAFFVVAAAIGGIDSPWGVLAIPAGVLGGAAFSAPLIAYAATRDTDRSFSVIMRLAIMPLFLFSGTFFPVHRLPDWLQPVAWFSPLFHAVELCRGAMRGSIAADRVVIHLVVLIAVLLAGCWAGARTFRERLAP